MSTSPDALSWSSLQLKEPEIPWDDLRAFAAAAADSSEVRGRLIREMTQCLNRRYGEGDQDTGDLVDLAVPAVFALAAERLDGEGRHEAAEFLLQSLYLAGEEDDDFLLEVLELATGRLGPELIEPALRLFESKGRDLPCWVHLVNLLRVAREADESTRAEVIRLCRRLIRDEPDRFDRFSRIICPAYVLADLGDTDSLTLLRSIYKKSRSPDLKEAIDRLEGEGEPDTEELMRPWTRPVEQWLPDVVEQVRDWLEHEDDLEDDDEDEDEYEDEHESAEDRYDDLVDQFLTSPACDALPEPVREDAGFAISTFLQYAWDYLGVPVEELGPPDVREILLDYYPRKISAEKEFFERAPAALLAFVRWLGQTDRHENPEPLCTEISRSAGKMLRRSQNPSHWGMAKTVHMRAEAAGVDTTDPEAVMGFWNSRFAGNATPRPVEARDDELIDRDFLTPPLVRNEPKTGRNDPCPCGSGKKYKKCCGK